MVFGGSECVRGGYLELEVLILVFGCEIEKKLQITKNLNLSESSLSESREKTFKRTTPNTIEHFNQSEKP